MRRLLIGGMLVAGGMAACAPPPPSSATLEDEIFVPSCGFSSCHGAGAGELWLEAGEVHDALVGVASVADPSRDLVVPGDADASYLVDKLEGAPGIVGDAMPPGGTLPQDDIDAIRLWIDEGAAP